MKIPFIGPTETERSRDVDYQRTVNWYPEKDNQGNMTLYPMPGTKQFTKVGDGPIRGSIVFNDKLWVVSGDTLFEIDTAGTPTSRGTLNTSGGRVSMAHNGKDNGQQLIIVDGSKGYLYDISSNSFNNDIGSSTNFPDGATHVKFIDSFFIANDPSFSGRWRKSNSYDGSTWDANDFATAERDPDELKAIEISSREIWLFGAETTEIWYNTGGAAFPFSPNQSAFIEWGIAAPFSVAESDGTLFWLSQNEEGQGVVLTAEGYKAQIVSSFAIAEQISEFTTIGDAFGYIFQFKQHLFYVLTFPSADRTFVYDITQQVWFEWETEGARHIGNTHSFFDGKQIVGSKSGPNLFTLRSDVYTDNGAVIERIRRSQHISVDDKPAFHHSLVVEMQMGVANNNDPTPEVVLRWSNDGGYTWSNEYWRSLGKTGEYNKQIQWRKLGRARDRMYELKVTDAVNPVVINAYANVVPTQRETD